MRSFQYWLIVAFALSTMGGVALAQDYDGEAPEPTEQEAPIDGWGPRFVDPDGDGECDYLGDGLPWRGYGEGYGQGRGMGQGPAMVDEDGDGVCDYWAQGRRGRGRGRGLGTGQGPAFVDEDGDGLCDHWADGRRGRRGLRSGQCRWALASD